jgi:serine/threonine protein kinase
LDRAVAESTTALQCGKCGAALQADERFCGACGGRVDAGAGDEASPWTQVVSQLQAATIGEFELSRELGRGGMAAVYLAHEIALNRLVAIKVMAPGLFLGNGMVDRFRQEAVTVANLSHPNIITIHGVRQIEDLHFLVMKFVEGRSLESVLHSAGPLPIEVVRAVLFQVGSGLAYAHRRGVIHRDIKPANILLDGDGNAIVTDFGIAKLAEAEGQTQTGTMIGTPGYMSPEQCVGGQLTWSSDLYSLGIVAYELLTGAVPFSGTPFNVMQAHTITPPPSVRERRPDCPESLDAAVQRLLAKTPAERFESMAEALTALGAVPLLPGDPVRERLERLAIPDPSARIDPTIRPAHSPVPRSGPRVGQLTVTGAPDLIAAGDRFELRCVVRSDAGATLASRPVSWSTSDDSVAAVTANGLVTARAPGRVNISATCEGVLASVPMMVLPPGTGRPTHRRSAALAVAVTLIVVGAIFTASRLFRAAPVTPMPPAGAPTNAAAHQTDSLGTPPGGSATLAAVPPPAPRARTAGATTPPSSAVKPVSKPPLDTQPAPRHDSTPAPAPVTPPPPPPAPPPATVIAAPPGPTPAEVTHGVETTVQSYVAAIRARSVDQMRALYPSLSSSVATDWKNQFALVGHDGIERLDVTLVGTKVTPAASGDGATAQFTVKLTLVQQRGASQTSSIVMRGSLHRDGATWRFDLLDQERATR